MLHAGRREDSPVTVCALNVNLYTRVDTFPVLIAANSGEAVVFTYADVNVDVFASPSVVSIVSTGSLSSSIFPSSVLNGDTLVSLDFGDFGSLLVPVCGRKDAERDRTADGQRAVLFAAHSMAMGDVHCGVIIQSCG